MSPIVHAVRYTAGQRRGSAREFANAQTSPTRHITAPTPTAPSPTPAAAGVRAALQHRARRLRARASVTEVLAVMQPGQGIGEIYGVSRHTVTDLARRYGVAPRQLGRPVDS